MKHLRSFFLLSVLGFGVFAVISSCNTTEKPATSTDLAVRSCCGKPGDVGNSLGVGKYCSSAAGAECRTNPSATVCSQLLQDPTRPTFCCTQGCVPDAGTNTCGDGAKCTQDKGTQQWGCVPAGCVDTPAPGCML